MPIQVAPKPSRLDLAGVDIPEDINRWGFSRGATHPLNLGCGGGATPLRREPRSRLRLSAPSGREGGSRAEPLHVPNEVWYNVTIPKHLRASRLGGLPK